MPKKLTQAKFEARVIALGKGYKAVGTYTNNRTKVEINCPVHGSFFIVPNSLFSGRGCAKCVGGYTPTQEEFVTKVVALGKGYTVLGTYKTTHTKVEINCPIHGSFFINPHNLYIGRGCSKCSGNYRYTQAEIETRVEALDKGYTAVGAYKNNNTKVEINCRVHGSFFMAPSNLFQGKGCAKCAGRYVPTQKEFEARVIALNKGYSVIGVYKNNRTKVEINCSVHGSFFIVPSSLFSGSGCAKCASSGFNPSNPALLYYFEVEGLYKIGITNQKTVDKRYRIKSDREKINILMVTRYDNGQEALDAELLIKQTFKEFIYQGDSPLKGVGTSEMFTHDVLGLDI